MQSMTLPHASPARRNSRRRSREFALQGLYQWQLAGTDAATIEQQMSVAKGFDKTEEAIRRSSMVFISGGLGPTSDDITRDAVAALFKCPIEMDNDTVREITRRSAAAGKIMTEAALRQAQVLTKAEVLPNSVGYAPGQKIALTGGRFLFLLPGPPQEFIAVLEDNIVPWLQGRFLDLQPNIIKEIKTEGVGESDIVTLLEGHHVETWDVQLGFYPSEGKVDIQFTATKEHEKELDQAYDTIYKLLEPFIVNDEANPFKNEDSFF